MSKQMNKHPPPLHFTGRVIAYPIHAEVKVNQF